MAVSTNCAPSPHNIRPTIFGVFIRAPTCFKVPYGNPFQAQVRRWEGPLRTTSPEPFGSLNSASSGDPPLKLYTSQPPTSEQNGPPLHIVPVPRLMTLHVYMYIYIIHTSVCLYVYARADTYVRVYICIHVYILMHAYTHILTELKEAMLPSRLPRSPLGAASRPPGRQAAR